MEFPKADFDASKSVVAATAGGSRSGKGADWRSGTQQAPVSDGASLLPVSGSSRSVRSGKSGGSYVIKFPNNEETTLSAKGKLSVTGAKSAHITGVGVESPLNRGCELGFPQGGFIHVLPDGLVHVIGYPQFPAPQGCLISVPDGVVVKFYAVGEDNIDAYFYEAGDPDEGSMRHTLRILHAPLTDEEIEFNRKFSCPARFGCGSFRHTLATPGLLFETPGGPFKFTLPGEIEITARSKSVVLVGGLSLARKCLESEDISGLACTTDFSLGGSVILGHGGLVCVPGSLVLEAKTGCLVDVPLGGSVTLCSNITEVDPSLLDMEIVEETD